MKAIVTRYHGPRNVRGARIIADDGDGNRVIVSYPSELSNEFAHWEAAKALRLKMGWDGQMACGSLKDGYVWVFLGSGEWS